MNGKLKEQIIQLTTEYEYCENEMNKLKEKLKNVKKTEKQNEIIQQIFVLEEKNRIRIDNIHFTKNMIKQIEQGRSDLLESYNKLCSKRTPDRYKQEIGIKIIKNS